MEKDIKITQDINEENNIGTVQIADEVVGVIVSIAATEVEGVAAVNNKSLSKGVKISIHDHKVNVEANITVKYGYNIPATCAKVQEKIKNSVENMTGLKVMDVNVRVTGVEMQKD